MRTFLSFKKQAIFAMLLASICLLSCQKELSNENGGLGKTSDTAADLAATVTVSKISGFVTDENNLPVFNAAVKAGTATTSTNRFGYFEIRNANLVENAAFVSVVTPGYFKGFRTVGVTAGKAAFIRIKMIPKKISGTINGVTGGNVALTNGLVVALPANGVINASTGLPYTGTISVASFWINPEATDLNEIMPGDLRGINAAGAMKLLQTYGMTAVELTGTSGELLQVAAGKQATLTFSLPASLSASAPASIPLWYFDETNGLWKEDGTAVKTGNTYVGNVSHFSYWNCDIPLSNPVHFELNVVNAAGNPISNANISFNYANGQYTGAHGLTDSAGHVAGYIPSNSQLILIINTYNGCQGVPAYTQPVTTTTIAINLGTATIINSTTTSATISGTITDCSGLPLPFGYVFINQAGMLLNTQANASGAFSVTTLICGSNNTVTIVGVDTSTLQQGTPASLTLVTGANAVGNLTACGTSIQEFANYSLNGAATSITSPAGLFFQAPDSGAVTNMRIHASKVVANASTELNLKMTNLNLAIGVENLTSFQSTQTGATTIPNPVSVNITEYGAVGQYISGNFTGIVVGTALPNTSYNVVCNFRVKRSF